MLGKNAVLTGECAEDALRTHRKASVKVKAQHICSSSRCYASLRRCGKQYTERPAMSRIDSSTICSMCGYKEAAAFLPDSLQKEILRTIRTAEKNAD